MGSAHLDRLHRRTFAGNITHLLAHVGQGGFRSFD
jgi:hypothetical protein